MEDEFYNVRVVRNVHDATLAVLEGYDGLGGTIPMPQ